MPATNKLSLHQLRIRLAHTEALLPLTLLGLMTGILAGVLLILFRESVATISELFTPEGEDSFERLGAPARMLLPLTGAVLLTILIKSCPVNRRQYGVALGKHLKLPDNTLNALAGCGTAAAILASFNTPMAGVIFDLKKKPHPKISWILVEEKQKITHILPSEAVSDNKTSTDLTQHKDCQIAHSVNMRATLNDALCLMKRESVDVVSVIVSNNKQNSRQFCGVITREAIENFYHSV